MLPLVTIGMLQFLSAQRRVRGLHLDAVEAVFIIGLPMSAESYMHMAGRTGRLPHPYGQSVLLARGRELTKVIHRFKQTTGIGVKQWTHLGTGTPSRDEQDFIMGERKARSQSKEASVELASGGVRTTAGAQLDAALWGL